MMARSLHGSQGATLRHPECPSRVLVPSTSASQHHSITASQHLSDLTNAATKPFTPLAHTATLLNKNKLWFVFHLSSIGEVRGLVSQIGCSHLQPSEHSQQHSNSTTMEGLEQPDLAELPKSPERLVNLVQRIANATTKEEVEACNFALMTYQSDPNAFELAGAAYHLSHSDEQVRFFAALLIGNKAKQGPSTIDLSAVVQEVLRWLGQEIYLYRSERVSRRIIGTLTALFCNPASTWTHCISDLVRFIISGDVSFGQPPLDDIATAIYVAPEGVRDLVLDFVLQLGNAMIDVASIISLDSVHVRAGCNVNSVCEVLSPTFRNLNPAESVVQVATDSLCAWLYYVNASGRSADHKVAMAEVLKTAISLLPRTLSSLGTLASLSHFFKTVLKHEYITIRREDRIHLQYTLQDPDLMRYISMSAGILSQPPHEQKEADLDLAKSLAMMATAFCVSSVRFAYGSDDQSKEATECRNLINTFMEPLSRVCASEDCDVFVARDMFEFWHDLILEANGIYRNNAKQLWMSQLDSVYKSGCFSETVVRKFERLPENTEQLNTDPDFDEELDELEARLEIRLDARELLQHACDVYGAPFAVQLFQKLQNEGNVAHAASKHGQKSHWRFVEGLLYMLSQLSDSLEFASDQDDSANPEDMIDNELDTMFRSDWYGSVIGDFQFPTTVRRGAVQMIPSYRSYFRRATTRLLPTLSTLIKLTEDPRIKSDAAEALSCLCDDNRTAIAGAGLANEVVKYLGYGFSDTSPHQYRMQRPLVTAASSVVQALPASEQVGACKSIFSPVTCGLGRPFTADCNAKVYDECLELLAAMAKAFKEPADPPSSLDEQPLSGEVVSLRQFWTEGPGREFQCQVLRFLRGILKARIQVNLTGLFNVLRPGYRDWRPGPFTFKYRDTIDMILLIDPLDDRYPAVADLARDFSKSQMAVDNEVATMVDNFMQVLEGSITARRDYEDSKLEWADTPIYLQPKHILEGVSKLDPEIQAAFIAPYTVAAKRFSIVITHDTAFTDDHRKIALQMTLDMLAGPTSVAKAAAAEFWTEMLSAVGRRNVESNNHDRVRVAVQDYGKVLTRILVANIAGGALRSDLDRVTGPIRELVRHYNKETRVWLREAMQDPGIDFGKASDKDKSAINTQIVSLGGAIKTRAVVKDFWLKCRGLHSALS